MVCMCRPIHKKRHEIIVYTVSCFYQLRISKSGCCSHIQYKMRNRGSEQPSFLCNFLLQNPDLPSASRQLSPSHYTSILHHGCHTHEDVLVPSLSAGQTGRTASFAFQACFNPKFWESSIIMPLRTAGMWLLLDNRSPGLSVSNSSEVWFPNKAHPPLNSPYCCY